MMEIFEKIREIKESNRMVHDKKKGLSRPICRIFKEMSPLLLGIILDVVILVGCSDSDQGANRAESQFVPMDPYCEYEFNPLGINTAQPRFSWKINHPERGQYQTAYQILVSSSLDKVNTEEGDKWDSGRVESSRQSGVIYEGASLVSNEKCYWKVRVWDKNGNVSDDSEPAIFSLGLLHEYDWHGMWMGGGNMLRKEFTINDEISRATAYVAAQGYYELFINGEKVGDRVLEPAWTDYRKRILYSTYDVTAMLNKGKNAAGILLGCGYYVLKGYGDSPRFLLQMNIELANGTVVEVVSDDAWKATAGPIISDDVYAGEIYDARNEKKGWNLPYYDDTAWDEIIEFPKPKAILVSQVMPPIKVVKTIVPSSISSPETDVYVYDMGQNFAGWVELIVNGERGTQIQMRFAELLNEDGTINKDSVQVKATDIYILKGAGKEVWEPRFTYHGFRYVEITGFPGIPTLNNLRGRAVHSDVRKTGFFECSNPLLNQIHENIIWGQLSNLYGLPTDCPQRWERVGWMADAQVVAGEALKNFEMLGLYEKWMNDILDSQNEAGELSVIAPSFPFLSDLYPGDPAWATAYISIPWEIYLQYGDTRILEDHYVTMKKWLQVLDLNTGESDYIVTCGMYGDWCVPSDSIEAPIDLISSFYYYEDALTMAEIAAVLGKRDDAEDFLTLSENIKESFNNTFYKSGYYGTEDNTMQTANILPLFYNMIPEGHENSVLQVLLNDISAHDNHLDTGIIGTKHLFDVLMDHGYGEIAYSIATQRTYPSWGYMIDGGATTLWEYWEYRTDTSHNHIMLGGSIDKWFYEDLAGLNIDPLFPGYERIIIRPNVLGDLSYVSSSIQTVRGIVSSEWSLQPASFTLDVDVPVNSIAIVCIPLFGHEGASIFENGNMIWDVNYHTGQVSGVEEISKEADRIEIQVGSGEYHFESRW